MGRRFFAAGLLALALLTKPAAGQTPASPQLTVRVRVIDSAKAGVGDVQVTILHGLSDVLARGTTDAAGRATLTIPRTDGELQVSARKLGYTLSSRFFALPAGDATSVEVSLTRTPQSLAPVKVTAAQDLKRKSYYIGEEDILNSPRTLFNAMDIVTKLKPDIITGRAGPGMDCGVKYIWVNGVRIIYAPPDAMVLSRIPAASPIPTPTLAMKSGGRSGRRQPNAPISLVDSTIWLVLSSIKPEHIAEMTYEDCFSTKVEKKTHANQALYVVLKEGVVYDEGVGSVVITNQDSLVYAKLHPHAPPLTRKPATVAPVAATAPATPATLPAYRSRLLGVYDAESGDPVEHVIVADSSSGTSAETTVTGTVSLIFLPEGPSTLFLKKPGFVTQRVDVTISPSDTIPLTIVMTRAKSGDAPSTPTPPGGGRTPHPDVLDRSRPRAR